MDGYFLEGTVYLNQREQLETCKGKIHVLVTKSPLYNNEGKCIGVIGSGVDITGYWVTKKGGYWDEKSGLLHLGESFCNEYLTKREVKVLKQILLGYTAKQIAKNLDLSPRTVESYIEVLKYKLQCRSKGDIIATAINAGFLYLVDEKF